LDIHDLEGLATVRLLSRERDAAFRGRDIFGRDTVAVALRKLDEQTGAGESNELVEVEIIKSRPMLSAYVPPRSSPPETVYIGSAV